MWRLDWGVERLRLNKDFAKVLSRLQPGMIDWKLAREEDPNW